MCGLYVARVAGWELGRCLCCALCAVCLDAYVVCCLCCFKKTSERVCAVHMHHIAKSQLQLPRPSHNEQKQTSTLPLRTTTTSAQSSQPPTTRPPNQAQATCVLLRRSHSRDAELARYYMYIYSFLSEVGRLRLRGLYLASLCARVV